MGRRRTQYAANFRRVNIPNNGFGVRSTDRKIDCRNEIAVN
jgi:hypothetical protein